MFQETYIHRVTTPTLLVYPYKSAFKARCDETSIWWDKCQISSKKRLIDSLKNDSFDL
jgi:hypothetical protein